MELEQIGQAKDIPAYNEGVGTRHFFKFLPIPDILWFFHSMSFNSITVHEEYFFFGTKSNSSVVKVQL